MSWQSYVDSSLVGSGKIDKAIIASIAGDSVWAASPVFHIKPHELKIIAEILSNSERERDDAFAEGLYVAGERFVMTRAEDGSLYARAGREGVCIAKSNRAIIIGHHPETAVAGDANATVETLADYLISVGY
ncbi:profilin [Aspergillus carlsbadensis]|nr:profilin [Aspergillus carlsbadensis]